MPDKHGALIGCGFFARNHMHAWNEVEGADIVAVCDTDANRARAFAQEFDAAAFVDAATMMRETKLDFVDIVTQPKSHRSLVELAAAHRLPIVCQKPLAREPEDARAMVRACATADVPLMVHENFRWQKPMRALKTEAADLGELFFGRISFRSAYDVYRNQPYLAEDPRFIIADLGVHLLDLARFFFGEVEALTCVTQRIHPAIKGEDVATILLKMRSGATCLVDLSYATQLETDLFPQTLVTLEGRAGCITLGPHYALTTVRGRETTHRILTPPLYSWSQPVFEFVQDSVVTAQQHWIDCLRTGQETETSGSDNLKTLALVFGSYQSAETEEPYHP